MGNQGRVTEEVSLEYQEIEDELSTSGEFKALVIAKSMRELIRREAIAIMEQMS